MMRMPLRQQRKKKIILLNPCGFKTGKGVRRLLVLRSWKEVA